MPKITSSVAILILLTGCVHAPCSRGICGCWKNYTFRESILINDSDSNPLSGATLTCETSKQLLGVTDTQGTAKIRIKGKSSPGCGMMANCDDTQLRSKAGDDLGSIELTKLLRKRRVAVGDYNIEIIREAD